MPPAPARFSMKTDCPHSVESLSVRMRPRVSIEPPGGNGMISRTARSGKVCARAGIAGAAINVKTNAAKSLREFTTLSRFRTSLPRILHRRRQDDNDDGAERDRREARD